MKLTKSVLDLLDAEGFSPGAVYGAYGAYWFNRPDAEDVASVRLYCGNVNLAVSLYRTMGSEQPDAELRSREWWKLSEALAERLRE